MMMQRLFFGLFTVFLIGSVDLAWANSGSIMASHFTGKGQIIFAETTGRESGIKGKVVNRDELAAGEPSATGAVELDFAALEPFLDREAPRHQVALFKDGNEPTEAEVAVASGKDDAEWLEIQKGALAAFQKSGLKVTDPKNEVIVYFYFGKAKMKIIECLKGDLKPGDEVTVEWDNVPRSEGCPSILPWEGKQIWMIDDAAKAGGTGKWIHGFYADLEMAKAARSEAN